MFDHWVLSDDGFENVVKDGKIVGFQLKSRINYYRGVPLSMVENIEVTVDGKKVDRDKIRFFADENWFTLDEMQTVTSEKWEFGTQAVIFVEKEGGLEKGKHEVTLFQSIRVPYYPMPNEARNTKTLIIE